MFKSLSPPNVTCLLCDPKSQQPLLQTQTVLQSCPGLAASHSFSHEVPCPKDPIPAVHSYFTSRVTFSRTSPLSLSLCVYTVSLWFRSEVSGTVVEGHLWRRVRV
jgi:hypothetical protein